MKPRIGIVLGLMLLAGLSAGCASALQKAVGSGDAQAVRSFLAQGEITDEKALANALLSATMYGHVEVVSAFLDHGMGVHTQGACYDVYDEALVRYSALECASAWGNPQVVKLLLDRGATISDRALFLALDRAAPRSDRLRWQDVVELLLERGANANAQWSCYKSVGPSGARVPGYSALDCNAHEPRVVKALLDHGATLTDRAIAAAFGTNVHVEAELLQILLDHGMDVDRALLIAAGQRWVGNHSIQVLLERGANIHAKKNGRTPLEIARKEGNAEAIRLLEEAEAKLYPPPPPVAAAPLPEVPAHAAVMAVPASDVDQPPARRVKAKPHAYAVVIGIEQYRQNLPKADFAARDARTTRDYLTKVMGYQDENVAILLNDRATKGDVEKYIEHWLPNRVEKTGTVFVYFSGHGAPNAKTGDAYLVPYDGDPAFVEATGYSLKRLYDHLGKLPAREVVVMLDSCFSGAGGRSVIGKGMRPMVLTMENQFLAGGKTVVLAASSGAQVSSTYDQKGHGLLTYYFLKGLQGEADTNKDGMIDLVELFGYVKPQVERTARRDFNNDQQPQLFGNPELLTKGIRLVEQAP